MIVRNSSDVEDVNWGNGTSKRLLIAKDGLGYTITDTTVNAGTRSPLEYKNHFESCYCISGSGAVIDADGNEFPLEPGTMYALDKNDPHWLVASPLEDLRLICVFSPALVGNERHDLNQLEFSSY